MTLYVTYTTLLEGLKAKDDKLRIEGKWNEWGKMHFCEKMMCIVEDQGAFHLQDIPVQVL